MLKAFLLIVVGLAGDPEHGKTFHKWGTTLAEASAPVTLFPQRLINVPVRRGFDWRASETVASAERVAVSSLGPAGRVLLRPSGTEPVLRVMVEARERALADAHAETIAHAIAVAAGQAL